MQRVYHISNLTENRLILSRPTNMRGFAPYNKNHIRLNKSYKTFYSFKQTNLDQLENMLLVYRK